MAALFATTGVEASQPACATVIFDEQFAADLDALAPQLVVTASVFDAHTGCWYELNPQERLTTASAIKLQILAANLWEHQRSGTTLSPADRAYAERMLWYSHNSPSTSSLYANVGVTGMASYSDAVGENDATHTAVFGVTRASAHHLTSVAMSALDDNATGPLDPEHRQVARDLLDGVHPSQRWGISAGLPDGWTSRLKNGFFPCTNCGPFSGQYTWRVASTGMNVETGTNRGYGISILTDGAASQAEGVAAVEFVSRHVASALTDGPESEREVDRANCTEVLSGESATAIAGRLGLTSDHWAEIRWTSGNEGPIRGQQMCGDEARALIQPCICPDVGRRGR